MTVANGSEVTCLPGGERTKGRANERYATGIVLLLGIDSLRMEQLMLPSPIE